MLRGLGARLRALLFPGTVAREIDEELQSHLEYEIERHVARGMSRRDAEYAARRAVGNVTLHREAAREAYGWRWVHQLAQDLRYASRTLRRSPGFAAAAVLSLALAIGANTAIFGAIDALLLRKLAVARPDQLVTLEQVGRDGWRSYNYSFGDYEQFRRLTTAFSGVFATTWADGFNVIASGEVDERQARVSVVTGNFFSVLGVRAQVGRTLGDDDDRIEGGHPVVVISDAYWARRFHRASDVVGRTLTMLGTAYTIIGVTPPRFSGDWVGWPTDLWVPVAMLYQVFPWLGAGPRGGRMQYKLVARLREGVGIERAQAAGAVVHARLAADASPGSGVDRASRFVLASAASGYSSQRQAWQRPLVIAIVVVGVVLLIACANIGSLLLARAVARQRELAVRLSLGASRARLVRQLLTESILLSLLGGALGLVVAGVGADALDAFARSGPAGSVTFGGASSVILDLRPTGRVLAFSAAVCGLATLLFGVAPAVRGSRPPLSRSLFGRGPGTIRPPRWLTVRGGLVVAQVALSLVLLVGAGLFARSLRNLVSADLGFGRDRLLLVWTLPGYAERERTALLAQFATIRRRVASLPGVASASATVGGIFSGAPGGSPPMRPEGSAPDRAAAIHAEAQMTVGPDFFKTVGQRLIAGRDFASFDTDSAPRVMIVDERFARRVFGGVDAVGRRLVIGGERSAPPYEIVGVVANATYGSPRDRGGTTVYFPYTQARNLARLCLAVRVTGSPAAVAGRVRRELRAIDPLLPVLEIDTVDEQLEHALFRDRLLARLSVFFGVVALLLACVGLYGVTSYTTARRTNEICIRMALGATRGRVLAMVLEESLLAVAAGTAIGVAMTLGLGRLVASQLYGVGAADPLTIAGIAFLLAAVAVLAAYLPARRAASVSPTVALRSE